MAAGSPITITEVGTDIRAISQALVPFDIPVGFPVVNPFSDKQMHFRKQYKISGVTVDEAVTGVLFSNYRTFMDVKEETYSRTGRTRHLSFNPFTIELEQLGRRTGEMGATAARGTAALMGAGLGFIEWTIRIVPPLAPDAVSLLFTTTNALFSGHFRINVRTAPGGVLLEDDWTPTGGADMRTGFLLMANLVLLTHPKGFEHIADQFIAEITRARARGAEYVGEIGPPSVEER